MGFAARSRVGACRAGAGGLAVAPLSAGPMFPAATPSPLWRLRKAWLHPSPLCHRQGLLPAPSLPVSKCNWPAEPGPALPGPLHQGQDVAVEARGGIQTPDEVPVVPVSNVHVGDDVGNAGQQQVHVPPVGCPVLTS